jgi:SAM-dependent methyltransferase
VLAHLATPLTVEELAVQLGAPLDNTTTLCQALHAHGITERVAGRYQVSSAFAVLDDAGQPLRLSEQIAANEHLQRAIETSLSEQPGFPGVNETESLALARLAWGRATSPLALEAWRGWDAQMPEVRSIWELGGHHAEFGCGVGRDLLRLAVMYPQLHVIGYDVAGHLLEECRDLAEELGVADRVSLVQQDVRSLDLNGAYDTVMWSQMFFPPETRAHTMQVIRRALREGGLLLMPLMAETPSPDDTYEDPTSRALLLTKLAYARWEIQWQRAAEVRSEVERAGFIHVRTMSNPRTPYMVMQVAADA